MRIEHIEELLTARERAPLFGGAHESRAYARDERESRDSMVQRPYVCVGPRARELARGWTEAVRVTVCMAVL